MLSWEDIIRKYISKYSNQIQKATQPLKDHFGINYFTYHHIDNEGKYTVLVDRPDWAEHYVGEKIYLNDPYLRNPKNFNSGISLIDSHGSKEYKKTVLKAGKKVLKADMGVVYTKRSLGGVEFFGYAGNKDSCELENLYLNDRQLLLAFGNFFKEECNFILEKMYEEANTLLNLKGKDYLFKELVNPDITPISRYKYLSEIGMKNELVIANKLTRREKECLQLLLENKTSKEIAARLLLSTRTVEFYFENIKDKLNCWTKQEIFTLAKKLKELGLI